MVEFDSLVQFLDVFGTEDACRDYLTKIIWQNGAYCPHCGSKRVYHFSNGRVHKCAKCRKQFSIKVGTIFEDSKIPLKKWFMAIYLITCHKKGISSLQLSRDLGITQKTAWFMLQRLRYAMQTQEFTKLLDGICAKNQRVNNLPIFPTCDGCIPCIAFGSFLHLSCHLRAMG